VLARLTALLCLLALAAPVAAVAQDNPFGPIPQAPPQQTAPPEQPDDSSSSSDDGLSRSQQLLLGIAGLVLLLGIGWAIVRDARSAAPVSGRDPLESGERAKATRPPKQRRVAQGRARAKRARRARKRNR